MRIDLRNIKGAFLFSVDVDPGQPTAKPIDGGCSEVHLHWDHALDDRGGLQRCPVCECRELFARKDFPQATGLTIVVVAAVTALVMFGLGRVTWAILVLGGVALIDAFIFPFAKRCLVCYRCRSEFRRLPIRSDHPGWDLATGEKYRSVQQPHV